MIFYGQKGFTQEEIQDGGGVSGVALTSSQDQYGITTNLWRNHVEQTTEQ